MLTGDCFNICEQVRKKPKGLGNKHEWKGKYSNNVIRRERLANTSRYGKERKNIHVCCTCHLYDTVEAKKEKRKTQMNHTIRLSNLIFINHRQNEDKSTVTIIVDYFNVKLICLCKSHRETKILRI